MKTIRFIMMFTLLAAHVSHAGDRRPGDAEEEMRRAMARERQRAEESAQRFGDMQRFEERYGRAKETQPGLYEASLAANRKAAEKWSGIVRQCESAKTPETVSEAKLAAQIASSQAELAEMELKYALAEGDRRQRLDKARGGDLGRLAKQLSENEQAILEANRAKHEASAKVDRLYADNRALNKAFEDVYRKSREDQKKDECKDERKDDRRKDERRGKDDDRLMPQGGRAPQID